MQLRSGWPVLRRTDGVTQVGLDPFNAVIFPDETGAIAKVLDLLNNPQSLALVQFAARREAINPDILAHVLAKIRKAGALKYEISSLSTQKQKKSVFDSTTPTVSAAKAALENSIDGFTAVKAVAQGYYSQQTDYCCVGQTENKTNKNPIIYLRSNESYLSQQLSSQLPIAGFTRLQPWKGKPKGNGLVIDIDGPMIDPHRYDILLANDIPHLPIRVVTSWYAVAGPIVIPGQTPCYRCYTMEKISADPAYLGALIDYEKHTCPTITPAIATSLAAHVVLEIMRFNWGYLKPGEVREFHICQERANQLAAQAGCGCQEII